jgi:hypothetical protein
MSCISNSVYSEAEGIRTRAVQINAFLKSAQLIYEAARNGQDLIDNYRKQHELAKRAQALAEAMQGQQSMYWGAENQFKNEFTNPEPIEDVEVMARRYGGRLVSSVLGGFASKIHEVKCNMNRYCTSANMKALQDIYLMRSFAVASARTLARNIAHAEWQARNDLNWERRKQAAALGKKLSGDASGLIKSAGQGLASIGAGYEQGLNSALKAAGLAMIRPDLAPENRANAGMVDDGGYNFAQEMSNSASQNNDEYNYVPAAPYQSNYGNPMYGPEASGSLNSLATTLSGNETLPPADLLGSNDLTGSTITDGEEMPSVYNDGLNQNNNGPQDRVRIGKIRFPVIGGFGNVEVDMSKFPVGYADHLETGGEIATIPVGNTPWPS